MSIVRIGLAQTKNFSDGYEAIFGTKRKGPAKKAKAIAKKAGTKKKPKRKK